MAKQVKPVSNEPVDDRWEISKWYDENVNDTIWMEALKIADPTGVLSYRDVAKSLLDGEFHADDVLNIVGALPLIGKFGKGAKLASKALFKTGAKDLSKISLHGADEVWDLTRYGGGKRAKKAFDKYQERIEKFDKYTGGFFGIPVADEAVGKWATKNIYSKIIKPVSEGAMTKIDKVVPKINIANRIQNMSRSGLIDKLTKSGSSPNVNIESQMNTKGLSLPNKRVTPQDMAKAQNLFKFALGGVVGNQAHLDDPMTALYQSQIDRAYAQNGAFNNNTAQVLDFLGNTAQRFGKGLIDKGMTMGEKGLDEETNKTTDEYKNKMKTMGRLKMGTDNIGSLMNAGMFAMGGQIGQNGVPVEVEGEEVGQTPDGQTMKFKGPSHEEGGIDTQLPEGTEIYSKRIKVDGVSMADRKGKRVKKTLSLEKLLEEDKHNALLRNTIKRTRETQEAEEKTDTEMQSLVKNLLQKREQAERPQEVAPEGEMDEEAMNQEMVMQQMQQQMAQQGMQEPQQGEGQMIPQEEQEFAFGGYVGGTKRRSTKRRSIKPISGSPLEYNHINPTSNLNNINPLGFEQEYQEFDDNVKGSEGSYTPLSQRNSSYIPKYQPGVEGGAINYEMEADTPVKSVSSTNPLNSKTNSILPDLGKVWEGTKDVFKDFKTEDVIGNTTLGDAMSLYGNYRNMVDMRRNTEANRAGDTPNINAFRDYGKQALKSNDDAVAYQNYLRDKQMQDIEMQRVSSMNRNNNGARGLNTLRALGLATDNIANDAVSGAYEKNALEMQKYHQMRSTLLNSRDEKYMQGEDTRDDRDRQDRDNYFTQRGLDINNANHGLQELGKNINNMKERDAKLEVLKSLGNKFEGNANGKITGKKSVVVDKEKVKTNTPNSKPLSKKEGQTMLDLFSGKSGGTLLDQVSGKSNSYDPYNKVDTKLETSGVKTLYDYNNVLPILGGVKNKTTKVYKNKTKKKK